MHKDRVCRLGFRLSADGGLQMPTHRQRPDQLLPTVQVEPSHRRPVTCARPAALSPPPEAVEGMAWVPGAGCPRHNGR